MHGCGRKRFVAFSIYFVGMFTLVEFVDKVHVGIVIDQHFWTRTMMAVVDICALLPFVTNGNVVELSSF